MAMEREIHYFMISVKDIVIELQFQLSCSWSHQYSLWWWVGDGMLQLQSEPLCQTLIFEKEFEFQFSCPWSHLQLHFLRLISLFCLSMSENILTSLEALSTIFAIHIMKRFHCKCTQKSLLVVVVVYINYRVSSWSRPCDLRQRLSFR